MKTLLTFLLLTSAVAAQSQSVKQDTIYITSQAYPDSIVLRWAPGSTHLWKVANKVGYKVERRKSTEKDFAVISGGPLKPYILKEWKQKADTTNVHVATAAQVLLGNIMMQPQKAITFSQKLLTSEEERNRLALGLYSAEFNIQAATGLALRWVDKKFDKETVYYYRVSLYSLPKNTNVLSTVTRVNSTDVYKPQPVVEVEAEGKDGIIEIRWNKPDNDRHFSGYFIERSEDGKKFTPLKDIPFKTNESENPDPKHIYKDSIAIYNKDYYYRVRGITSFADYGAYSAVVKAHTRDLNAPAPPSMLRAESLDEKSVKLTWTDNPVAPDHNGYFIGRSAGIHGPFEKINAKPFKTSLREFIDEHPIPHKPNFYTIIAVDKSGNENQSVVAMAVLKDYTPPARPVELIGKIDTLGVVSLAWKMGGEEDLLGYRVYRADHPKAEFIQITREPIPGNFYMDTIPLNTLTEKVYYKVAAFDFNYNPSEYSVTLELNRPDYAPPVKPVITNYFVRKDTIQIQWVPSSSKDVVRHVLYRMEENGEWKPLAEFNDKTGIFNDLSATPGKTYHYSLEAVDDAGLSSGKTKSIQVVSGMRQLPPVKNVTGVFDKNAKAFKLNWEYDQQGAYKFVIYRATEGELLSMYGSTPGKLRTFTDKKFYRNEKGYSYAVKVLFPDGTESALSDKVTVVFKR